MIHNKIIEAQVEFETSTGKKAANVYLGREEIKELLKWAEDNQYIVDAEKASIEGESRPEVNGLFVYKVNDDTHLVCA